MSVNKAASRMPMIFKFSSILLSSRRPPDSTHLHHFDEFDNVGVPLAAPQQLDLARAVDAARDDLDGALDARLV